MSHQLEKDFLNECKLRFESSLQRLDHCLSQLDNATIWWKPNEQMNSIGMLINHICGSFRQWTITQINKEEDLRHRPDEFSDTTKIPKKELEQLVAQLRSDFISALAGIDPARLTEQKRIQGNDVTLMSALFRALTHLEGHIGQIMLLTRIRMNNDYTIFWTPKTEEQKSERKK